MIKKKVAVNKKDTEHNGTEPKPVRGRPRTGASKTTDADVTVPRLPSSRVFSVGIEGTVATASRTNTIIRLKLKIGNINKLERFIVENKGVFDSGPVPSGNSMFDQGMLLREWEETGVPCKDQATGHLNVEGSIAITNPSKGSGSGSGSGSVTIAEAHTPILAPAAATSRAFTGLEHFIKLRSTSNTLISPGTLEEKPVLNRKDLIINSGIKRTTQESLQVFADSWPLTSPYACWYCCHTFDTTPVGIPAVLTNYMFKCYGNFCSYNCAKRYLCPLKDDEDDMASMQSSNDLFKGDDQGEKLQLLELLYHLETGADMDEPIKTAPRRLILKMFGGNKTIEEFRKSFRTNTVYHTFRMPLASMAYHMEECVDTKSDIRRKLKNMSLDVARLEQAYDELMREKKRNSKLSIQKVMSRDNLTGLEYN